MAVGLQKLGLILENNVFLNSILEKKTLYIKVNPGNKSVKVQTETFLKKDSRDFKNSFYLGFL